MPTLTRPKKITFGEVRVSGVRDLLVYCADYRCSHSTTVGGDRWPDDADRRLSLALGLYPAGLRNVRSQRLRTARRLNMHRRNPAAHPSQARAAVEFSFSRPAVRWMMARTPPRRREIRSPGHSTSAASYLDLAQVSMGTSIPLRGSSTSFSIQIWDKAAIHYNDGGTVRGRMACLGASRTAHISAQTQRPRSGHTDRGHFSFACRKPKFFLTAGREQVANISALNCRVVYDQDAQFTFRPGLPPLGPF